METKISVKSTTTTEVEMEIPAYVKTGDLFYSMVYSEESCINVCLLKGHEHISNSHSELPFIGTYEFITKELFEEKLASTIEQIKNYAK